MLAGTKLALVEISNIGYNMAQSMNGYDPQQQFKRIQRIAEQALAEERQHEKALLARLNSGEDA